MAEHWMRFNESDLCWASFRENGDGSMAVLAVINTTVIWNYETLPRADARDIWRKLRDEYGFRHVNSAYVEAAGMSTYALGLRALPQKYQPRR